VPTVNQVNTYSVLVNPSTSSTNTIVPRNIGVIPLTIKALSGQTADLQEWQNNSGTVLIKITSTGILSLPKIGTVAAINNVASSINFLLSQTILQGII
jgi:hypothetical protein